MAATEWGQEDTPDIQIIHRMIILVFASHVATINGNPSQGHDDKELRLCRSEGQMLPTKQVT